MRGNVAPNTPQQDTHADDAGNIEQQNLGAQEANQVSGGKARIALAVFAINHVQHVRHKRLQTRRDKRNHHRGILRKDIGELIHTRGILRGQEQANDHHRHHTQDDLDHRKQLGS